MIARNYGVPGLGEIDIVARAPEGELVMVEVKTLRSGDPAIELMPEDNLTGAKLGKMRNAANAFLARNPKLLDARGWRMDVIAVAVGEEPETKPALRHYKNVS